ncbi:hypothetical protein NC661_20110 [Aquibacillus koreensis]|uniref:Uncharacterized protein n=1 Tax=Aquibacillus koreensis TaxID=279446 RepID=A0A9X4AJW8_9BACI|nr:hypothetical protein [Aquibacillus koreensis]MCT2537894.1 hypothetical protein [Aquibacillus koreensis]MDC3422662.1 hypothetical protein [Aquibacillus koreensis]
MWKFVIGYFIFQIVLLIVILVITNKTDKKSKKRHIRANEIPPGFEKTSESFIDSYSNKVIYVYYNKDNGERVYVEQD